MSAPATPEETNRKIIAAQGEAILHQLEGLLMRTYNVYDVAKAIPHPYDALGGMGSDLLHDLKAFAFTVKKHVEQVNAALEGTS